MYTLNASMFTDSLIKIVTLLLQHCNLISKINIYMVHLITIWVKDSIWGDWDWGTLDRIGLLSTNPNFRYPNT